MLPSRLAALAFVTLTACGAANRTTTATTTVTASSAPAPAIPRDLAFQSEALRFGVRASGAWRSLDAQNTRRMNSEASYAAMATHGDGVALVIVEHLPGVNLEDYGNLWARGVSVEQRVIRNGPALRVAGEDAVRTEVDGLDDGVRRHFVSTAVLHQGYFYNLIISPPTNDPRSVDAFVSSFVFLPGEVRRSEERRVVADRDGSGSRVRNGRYESGATGTVLASNADWRLLEVDEQRRSGPDAEIGGHSTHGDVWVSVVTEHVPLAEQTAYRRYQSDSLRTHLPDATGAPGLDLDIAGATRPFEGFVANGIEYLVNHSCHASFCSQITIWFPPGASTASRAMLQRTPPPLTFLAEPERTALLTSLPDTRSRSRIAGPGYSLRGGRFVLYEKGISFELGAGPWTARLGNDVHALAENATVMFQDSSRGLNVLFMTEPVAATMGGPGYHEVVRRALEMSGPRHDLRFAAPRETVSVTEGRARDGLGLYYRLATVVRGGTGFRLAVFGYAEDMDANRAAIEALLRTIVLEPAAIPPTRQEGDRYVDAQFGYSLRIPTGLTYTDFLPADSRGGARADGWSSGDQLMMVLALTHEEMIAGDQIEIVMDVLAARMPEVRQATRRASRLAGREALQLAWTSHGLSIQAWVIDVHRVTYVFLASSTMTGGADLAAEGFALLP